ncbi:MULTISPECIES: DUF3221 domain-containing protein [unclassified Paenibacillus]|uniref:DUF3221 domain-containing protein n=1 Tax=unclassified Paenibacillus TaxID=185978 RepID=UPI000CFAFBF3|nr:MULTISPECIES: DUF3221 domain-containing protein [unclassified Paenibacillus]PRA05428.1 hypothetical protein CQ043_15525 [Paenibacillus sp. MYb63]PRA50225.1 hypothetical protein CQ061_07315 [Paenibacillus sp. MYb67]
MSNLRIVCTILSIWILGLTGCAVSNECKSAQTIANSPTEKGFTGYVVERKDNSILVVDPAFQNYSSNGGKSRYYPAKRFSNAPDPQIGSYVEVWTDGGPENQPYPGQARAEKIAVSCPNTPDGAHMTDADAIRSGLRSLDTENMHIPVIEDTRFDADTGTWTIQMRDANTANEGQVVHVTVKDEEKVKTQGGE